MGCRQKQRAKALKSRALFVQQEVLAQTRIGRGGGAHGCRTLPTLHPSAAS